MNGWTTMRLDQIADVIDPHPSHRAPPELKDGIPFPGIGDFRDDGTIDESTCRRVDEDVYKEHQKRYVVAHGDLGFGRVASIGKVVRLRTENLPYAVSPTLAIIKPRQVDHTYLQHFLEGPQLNDQIGRLLTGTTRSSLGIALLRALQITLPDPPEQQQIGTVLSQLDHAIEQTETLIAKQQRIKTGLMQDLLMKGIDEHGNIRSEATHAFKDSSLGRIPVEWEARTLGEIVHVIDPNPSHRYPPAVNSGIPIASTENFLGESDFDLSCAEFVPDEVYHVQNARCAFDKDDVVFARKGRIGLARPYGTEKKVFSHTVVLFKPREPDLQARFILWSVRFDRFFDEISKRMNSNSGVPTLGVGFIQAIPIRVPVKKEREFIVRVLDEHEVKTRSAMQSLEKLQRIRIGLMHDLLTGKRRVTAFLAQAATQ